MSLYNRKCQLCERGVISIYHPDSGLTIYCNKCWWSDKWDPKSFGVDYDFSRPFFTQFRELMIKVPHMAIVNDDGIASLNCEYTHDWWFSKNCYMCFSGWHAENVLYSFFVLAGKDIMDCIHLRSKSEWLFECSYSRNCYNTKYAKYLIGVIDSQFVDHCFECRNCFMCYGLRGKKYYFKNKEYSKKEYEKILESYRLDTWSGVQKAEAEYNEFVSKFFRRCTEMLQNLNCTGDNITQSKNVRNSFVIKNGENVRYSDYIGDNTKVTKDSYDITLTGGSSECYEGVVVDHSQLNLFGLFSVKSQDIKYNHHCHNCKHVFGCVGLRNTNYAIFNKQYKKEEYEKLVSEIKKQMDEHPYVDKNGNVYKFGEFFPVELSYFGYNETCAMEQFPMSKEEAIQAGYSWQNNTQKTTGKETLKSKDIPESIDEVKDNILKEILACIVCGRNYKIVPNELIFYRKMRIPVSRKCFHCRHKSRMEKINPFRLWPGKCMCVQNDHNHKGNCQNIFETSYPPEKKVILYCEKCYQKEVY